MQIGEAWGAFGGMTVALLISVIILIVTCYKCRVIKNQLKKSEDMHAIMHTPN